MWHEKLGEVSPKHWKFWKFHFDGLFLSKVYRVWFKKIQGSYLSWHWTVMQNLNKPWPCGFKNGMRNWVNFHYSTQKSEKLYIDGLFLSKAYNVSARKFQRNYVSWHWRVVQSLKKKLTLNSKNDMRNLVNFNLSSGKSENLHFDVLLLSIAYKVSAKKVQKNYLSWHWKKIQTLKKNWLFIWKMTWGIWWTLTWAVESLKICTLMGYFCRKYVMFELKRYRGVVLWKMTYGFKNDISNLVNFHTSSWK